MQYIVHLNPMLKLFFFQNGANPQIVNIMLYKINAMTKEAIALS